MDIVNDAFNLLLSYLQVVIDFLSPYTMEIVIGLVMASFLFGFIQSHR